MMIATRGPSVHDVNTGFAALEAARRRDPIGHEIHTVLAGLYLFSLPLTTAGSSVTFILLLIVSIVRLRHTAPAYAGLFRCGVLWLVLAWTAWHAASMAWSADPAQGCDELRAARVLATPWMLWPVLDRAGVLILSAIGGVLAANLVQAGQWLEVFGLSPAENNRLRGLIHPTQTGAWCVAAMCWSVSGVLLGRGWIRILSLATLLSAGAGLIATGSRGPWLAGAASVPLAIAVIAIRRPPARPAALVLIAAGLAGGLGAAWFARGFVERRIDTAITELRAGWSEEIYWTDGGLRIGLWRWAWDGFTGSPLVGQGAGSFETIARENPGFAAAREKAAKIASGFCMSRGHAHSDYFQVLCNLGIIGALIGGALVVALLRNAWRDRLDHPFADGNFFAAIGWSIGAAFDCYHLSGHTFGLLGALIAFTLPQRSARSSLPPSSSHARSRSRRSG
ncbi:MAG: O-antigen ligase family protein [Planctomycetes bacterium]|nr:O-antigen ligase family protein [Planctomycetota bacterium]